MALRDVNLMPAGLLLRRGLVRRLCFWAACLFAGLAAILGFHMHQTRVIRTQQPALQSLDEIQMHLGQRVSQIEQIRTELQRLDQQREVLDNLARNRSYCQVLARLAGILDDDVWLTQLAIDRNPEKNRTIRLGLAGLSFSNAALGNFINQICADPMFSDVQLVYAKEGGRQISRTASGKPRTLIQFEIESSVSNR